MHDSDAFTLAHVAQVYVHAWIWDVFHALQSTFENN